MKTLSYTVPNISCGHCVDTIKMEVAELEGVESVEGTVNDRSVVIQYDDPSTEEQIQTLLAEINYPPAAV